MRKDYDEYGYEFGTAGGRLDDLAEALPRIKSRLAVLNPAPTRPMPILIGGQGERKTLRLVAEHADIWHGFTNATTYPGKADVLARHCADTGRDPSTVERSSGVEGRDPETLVANAEALARLGVTLMTVGCDGPDYDLGPAQALLRWRDRRAGS
jgi:alkanesulfonate monooxygenase SsuD/methylene tetrahydromethanopterin reductase-like flavin-dependent oxidoreductase (luciferase family)